MHGVGACPVDAAAQRSRRIATLVFSSSVGKVVKMHLNFLERPGGGYFLITGLVTTRATQHHDIAAASCDAKSLELGILLAADRSRVCRATARPQSGRSRSDKLRVVHSMVYFEMAVTSGPIATSSRPGPLPRLPLRGESPAMCQRARLGCRNLLAGIGILSSGSSA